MPSIIVVNFLLLLALLYTSKSYAQQSIITSEIDQFLRYNSCCNIPQEEADSLILKTVDAVFKNLHSVTNGFHKFVSPKFTVIQSPDIDIRKLVDRREIIPIILKDTDSIYQRFCPDWIQDTTLLFSCIFVKEDFELEYYNGRYPQLESRLDPFAIQSQLQFKDFLFFCPKLSLGIDSLIKATPLRQRKNLVKYLSENLDYFDEDSFTIEPKAIQILTITTGDTNYVYAGVDIYGTHYLFTFNSSNWRLENVKSLWIY